MIHTLNLKCTYDLSLICISRTRTALQMLYNATSHARMYNFYVGGLSHTWMAHYISKLTDNGAILNEWWVNDSMDQACAEK